MIKNQIIFYDRAVEELLEEFTITFKKIKLKLGMSPKTYKCFYLIDGKKIENLLDIPTDAKVVIASDKSYYQGVEFENL